MIRKTPEPDTVPDVLRTHVQWHAKQHYISTDCSREVPWIAVVVPKQTIACHVPRVQQIDPWMRLTCLRDSQYGQVEFEIEADLVSVLRDKNGGYKVTYEVTGG